MSQQVHDPEEYMRNQFRKLISELPPNTEFIVRIHGWSGEITLVIK